MSNLSLYLSLFPIDALNVPNIEANAPVAASCNHSQQIPKSVVLGRSGFSSFNLSQQPTYKPTWRRGCYHCALAGLLPWARPIVKLPASQLKPIWLPPLYFLSLKWKWDQDCIGRWKWDQDSIGRVSLIDKAPNQHFDFSDRK